MIRRAVRLPVALAVVTLGALTACSGSGGGAPPASPSVLPSGAASSATSRSEQPTSSSPTPTAGSSTGEPSDPLGTDVTTQPVPATPIRTVTIQGVHATYTVEVWAQVTDRTCFDHAYGQPVITYLTEHPCRGLTRRLATTSIDGRGVGLAQSVLGFVGVTPQVYTTAADFQALVSKDGTGNLTDLLSAGYRLPSGPSSVPSPDAFRALAQDGDVTVTDAWYLSGPTPADDPALTTMAEDLFLQF